MRRMVYCGRDSRGGRRIVFLACGGTGHGGWDTDGAGRMFRIFFESVPVGRRLFGPLCFATIVLANVAVPRAAWC